MKTLRLVLALSTACLTVFATAYSADLQTLGRHARPSAQRVFVPKAPSLNASSYLLADVNSGRILATLNPNKKIEPASLTKMMTMYVVSGALRDGQIKLSDKVLVSKKAWKAPGSRMFIKAGDHVPVKQLLNGVIVASGNDAAMALAEHVAGSESAFVDLMNASAAALGMNDTHFMNPSGLPHAEHYTTAHDLMILARALILDYPEEYKLYKQKWFTYANIKQSNRNRLLWQDPTVDGVKTGHHESAGYCLVASAKRGDMRLISVVTGTASESERARESKALLNYGFRFFETHQLFKKDQPLLAARVWKGQAKHVKLGPDQDVIITIVKGSYPTLKSNASLKGHILAPVKKGQTVGKIDLKQNGKLVGSYQLSSLQADPAGGMWRRMVDAISYWWSNWFSDSADTNQPISLNQMQPEGK